MKHMPHPDAATVVDLASRRDGGRRSVPDFIVLLPMTPVAEGDILKVRNHWVAVDRVGELFRATELDARKTGMNIAGDMVRYAWLRPATPEEAEPHIRKETTMRKAEERRQRFEEAIGRVASAPLAGPDDHLDEARALRVWEGRRNFTWENRRSILLDDKDQLWFLERNTRHGLNQPGNLDQFTLARVMPATPELLHDLGIATRRPEPAAPEEDAAPGF